MRPALITSVRGALHAPRALLRWGIPAVRKGGFDFALNDPTDINTIYWKPAAGPALAHPGHETSGFLHPFTGLDHVLAMIGVGLWAAFLAGRKPAIAAAVPAAFLAMMAIGAAAGFAGIKLPLVEAAILASVFVIGGLIIGAVRLPVAWAMAPTPT